MSTNEFEGAVTRSKSLPQRPSNSELLLLYALFKQASEGDVTGDRPGGFDFKAIAKYDAWAELKGKDKTTAESDYIKLVNDLEAKYS